MLVRGGHLQLRLRRFHIDGEADAHVTYMWSGENEGHLPAEALALGVRDARGPWYLWLRHDGVTAYYRETFHEGWRLIWAAWAKYAGKRAWMRDPANREWLMEQAALARADAVMAAREARDAAHAAGLGGSSSRTGRTVRMREVVCGGSAPPWLAPFSGNERRRVEFPCGPDGAFQMAVTEEAGGATTTSIRRRDPQLCFEGSRVPDDSDTGSRMTVTVD